MSILTTGKRATLTRTAATAALALAAVGGLASASFAVAATQQAMTPSSTTGSQNGGNTLTLTLPTTATPKFTSGFVGVQFQTTTANGAATATCSTNPSTTASSSTIAATVRFLSSTKVSVVVPDLRASAVSGATGFWVICAYNQAASGSPLAIATTATVIGKANYVAAAAPTINAGDTGASPVVAPAVVPASGPASGGQVVTVNGTGFPTTITASTPLTATFAGVPLMNITPISATQFTAVTPAQPASTNKPVLTVTTNGGSVSASLNATPNTAVYTYVNGITVSPNTVASGVAVDVDVQGTGFTNLDFSSGNDGTTPKAVKGHVFLVQGVYNPTANGGGSKTVGESTECVNVAVISDSELICTVDAAHSITYAGAVPTYGTTALANGTYTVTVVDTGAIGATLNYKTVLSSGATFTVADF
ncbi:MAG: IPT/TIG domain-containing protein [Kineosporiaceae bacterium]